MPLHRIYGPPGCGKTTYLRRQALLALGHPTHATSGNRGVAYPFNDEAGAIPLGFADQPLTGDGTLRASIEAGGRIRKVAVTGASSAAATNGKWVFATDDGTFTLTKTTPNIPVGIVVDWVTSTTCWVYFMSFGELLALQASGGIHRTWATWCFAPHSTALGGAILEALTDRGTTKMGHSGSVAGYLSSFTRWIEDDAVVTADGCELITRGVPVAPDEIEGLMRA